MTRDYRDLVIEELAYCEAALIERVARLEADLLTERELRCHAIHALADTTRQLDRLRAQHQFLVDEYRALRQQLRLAA